jgi:uncharacterized protein (TIGR02246 family)
MKQFAAAIALLVASLAFAQPKASSDLAKIEQLEQLDAAAAKSNDIEALISLWTDDGVLIMPMSQPIVGKAAIRARLEQQKQQSANLETSSYVENWRERKINGDQCFEWGAISVTMKLPNGKEVSQTADVGRLLARERDGAWHFSRVIATPAPKE